MEYKREWDSLQYKISLVSELREKQIWWAPKLQALGELIPENIWIDKLSVQKSVQVPSKVSSPQANTVQTQIHPSMVLILEGFALPGDNQGFRSIENFAQQLKENPVFNKIIKEIDLTTATRTETEELSAMSFQLSCRLVAEENL
jgi:Tfp pilus assembly protein PilN